MTKWNKDYVQISVSISTKGKQALIYAVLRISVKKDKTHIMPEKFLSLSKEFFLQVRSSWHFPAIRVRIQYSRLLKGIHKKILKKIVHSTIKLPLRFFQSAKKRAIWIGWRLTPKTISFFTIFFKGVGCVVWNSF